MPRYEYACTVPECGHEFEAVQSFADDALTSCPACEGRLRKVFGAVGVVFKGSGFYRTDSRADSRGRPGGERPQSGEKSGAEKGSAEKGTEKGGAEKGSADAGKTSKNSAKNAGSGEKAGTSPSKAAAAGSR